MVNCSPWRSSSPLGVVVAGGGGALRGVETEGAGAVGAGGPATEVVARGSVSSSPGVTWSCCWPEATGSVHAAVSRRRSSSSFGRRIVSRLGVHVQRRQSLGRQQLDLDL